MGLTPVIENHNKEETTVRARRSFCKQIPRPSGRYRMGLRRL